MFSEQDENLGVRGGFAFVMDNDGTQAPRFSVLNKSTSTSAPLFVVNSSGKTGIGTSAPNATLEVNGYARLKLNSSQPATCSSANDNAGAIAMTSSGKMCVCSISSTYAWREVNSATSCSW